MTRDRERFGLPSPALSTPFELQLTWWREPEFVRPSACGPEGVDTCGRILSSVREAANSGADARLREPAHPLSGTVVCTRLARPRCHWTADSTLSFVGRGSTLPPPNVRRCTPRKHAHKPPSGLLCFSCRSGRVLALAWQSSCTVGCRVREAAHSDLAFIYLLT